MAFNTTVGDANATSYVTTSEFNTYSDDQPFLTEGEHRPEKADTEQIQRLLMAATGALDSYRRNFDGDPTTPETQRLEFPRTSLVDYRGYLISDSIIPILIKEATYEMALYLYTSERNHLFNSSDVNEEKVSIGGDVSIEYKGTAVYKVLPFVVKDKLKELNVWRVRKVGLL